jgi:hypothetical protein
VVLLSVVPAVVQAGWTSQWTNTALKADGSQLNTQNSSMAIADGRVRIDQPEAITLIDYNGGRFTLINPERQVFWSGTIDEYVRTIAHNRSKALLSSVGGDASKNPRLKRLQHGPEALPTVDASKLPPVTITKTDVAEKIAGYDTIKYEIRAGGDLFEEIWVAPALNVSSDLDPSRYMTVERKLGMSISGKPGEQYNALYASDEYRKLLENAFVLKMVNHYGTGSFQRAATSMQKADVPAKQFAVPAAYRKVQLGDVVALPTPAPKK